MGAFAKVRLTQASALPAYLKKHVAPEVLKDDERLEQIGLRTDDAVTLEFASPAAPPILTLLRKPMDDPSLKKKGKGGSRGKKKK